MSLNYSEKKKPLFKAAFFKSPCFPLGKGDLGTVGFSDTESP